MGGNRNVVGKWIELETSQALTASQSPAWSRVSRSPNSRTKCTTGWVDERLYTHGLDLSMDV